MADPITRPVYAKVAGEWVPVYPEPERGVAPVMSAAPDATQIVYTWTAATGITVASYEVEFDGVVQNVGNVLTFTKTGLTTGQTYTARVRAKTAENVRGEWSNLLSTVAAVPYNAATGGTETTVTNYNGTGQTWKVHTFTSSGTLTVTKASQPFRTLVCGGGGGGGVAMNANGGGKGRGGKPTVSDTTTLAVGPITVTVGGGGGRAPDQDWGGGATGGQSVLGTITAGGGGGGGGGESPYTGDAYSQNANIEAAYNNPSTWVASDITGTSAKYGHDGSWGGPQYEGPNGQGYGGGGRGGGNGWGNRGTPTGGNAGAVIVAYRIA